MFRIDFSACGWGRVILWTGLGTLGCMAMALADSFNALLFDEAARRQAIVNDIVLPLLLAVPTLLFLTSKLRWLAIAHQELEIIASRDCLTSLLNRRAFTALVDAYLKGVQGLEHEAWGALLVVDVDNFKSVNDSYGHDQGDEALRIIARSIANTTRGTDLVARIGGEEFGVFLPGSGVPHAKEVAERIRRTVNDASFVPDGRPRRLSVSIGGAVYESPLTFTELFRVADQQLYAAKQNGRNRVFVEPVTCGAAAMKAAA